MIVNWKKFAVDVFVLLLYLYFCLLMLEITMRYRGLESNASFLQIKQTEITSVFWYRYAFYIHVFFAIFALPAGITQFSKPFLNRYKLWHRRLGYCYVIAVLVFAAPSGFLIGLKANGGAIAQLAFLILALLWFISTFLALWKAKQMDFAAHKRFMIRSFALTCSAITLRLWKVVLVYFFEPNPMDLYQWVSWLGWLPNLLIAEWIINRIKQK